MAGYTTLNANQKAMSQQSKEAFLKGIESGKFESDKARIYKLILAHPQTIETIKASLCKDKSSFSSRLNDLLDIGVIEEKNGSRLTVYEPVLDKAKQEELADARYAKKYYAWIEQGKKHGYMDILIQDIKQMMT